MSDEEIHQVAKTDDGQMLAAEYKDGKLQIVEVSVFDKQETHIIPEMSSPDQVVRVHTEPDEDGGVQTKYLQVLDTSKGLVHLDLLNFTLVKCNEGDNSTYQMVETSSADDAETTLTCVLDDGSEDNENQNYVMVNAVEGSDPVVYLHSKNMQQADTDSQTALTPTEILEKAKALQKANALLQSENTARASGRGRKRKSDLPTPMELLASPNFKLYLYSCKMCSFKCNAVKEMSQHKASEHGSSRPRGGNGARSGATLQCARCPYRGNVHTQLMKHIREAHFSDDQDDSNGEVKLESGDISDADVLVCGACGFESGDKDEFTKHIEKKHGVNVMLEASVFSIVEKPDSN